MRDGATVQVVTPNPNDRCAAPPLTSEILEYSYIQALRDIANSPNNSTVILGGNGTNGGAASSTCPAPRPPPPPSGK